MITTIELISGVGPSVYHGTLPLNLLVTSLSTFVVVVEA